ncbi:hypothetical protein GW750_01720 [bacterium]|nr:hypothetical protein [bacterium]
MYKIKGIFVVKSMKKSKLFKKVKTEHTILKDFIKLLQYIEKSDLVQRIIP